MARTRLPMLVCVCLLIGCVYANSTPPIKISVRQNEVLQEIPERFFSVTMDATSIAGNRLRHFRPMLVLSNLRIVSSSKSLYAVSNSANNRYIDYF